MQETKPEYSRSLGYDKTDSFRFYSVIKLYFINIYLICFLSILSISQPKHGSRFILVILY
jgi:hypothetical protein